MDVATGEYGDVLPQLTSGVQNGRLIYNQDSAYSLFITPSHNSEGNRHDFLLFESYLFF